jgi:hypothetical protein
VATGAIGGLGLALVLLVAWELTCGPIHGAGAVMRHMGAPPLVAVPMLRPGDRGGWLAGLRGLVRWPGRRVAGGWA